MAAIVPGMGCSAKRLSRVDLKTGQRKWHYQLVHHGIWDMDIPCAPILADITVNGRAVKAVAQPTKQAFALCLRPRHRPAHLADRGEAGAEGRRAGRVVLAHAALPDASPAPYDRQGFSLDDLIDFTPELKAEGGEARIAVQDRTPFHATGGQQAWPGPLATLMLPSATGGTNWPGGVLRSGNAHCSMSILQTQVTALGLVRSDPAKSDMSYVSGHGESDRPTCRLRLRQVAAAKAAGVLTVQGLPLVKPPYGRITRHRSE